MRFPVMKSASSAPDPGVPAAPSASATPTHAARTDRLPSPVPPPTDLLSTMASAADALLSAENAEAILQALLETASRFGASRPKAGLWREHEAAYTMWYLDAGGEMAACGSAPAAVYASAPSLDGSTLPSGPILLASLEQRWGVLDVSGQVTDAAALAALGVLARQAVACLERTESGGANVAESDLLAVSERWWAVADEATLIATAMRDVVRLAGADSAALALPDPYSGGLRLLFLHDLPERAAEIAGRPVESLPWKGANDPRRNGEALLRVVRTGETIAFRWNPTSEALKLGLLPAGPSDGSYVAVPLVDSGTVLGALDVASPESRRFTPAHDELLARAARQLARILGHRWNAIEQAEAARRQLTLVNATSELANEMDLKAVAGALTRTGRTLWPDADFIYCMLPQIEGGLWSIAAMESARPDDQRQGWARAGDGFAGWVIQTKQSLAVSRAADDPRRGSLDRGQGVEAGLWMPVRRNDAMLGILAVGSRKPGYAYSPADMETLERLAEQGAVALERARERHGAQSAFWDAAEALAGAIDARDGYTHGHSRNVTEYAVAIAKRMDMPANEIQNLRAAALMHDIGKIGIPDHVLNKPGQLTPDERTIMESHPEVGYEILLRAPSLQSLLPGVRYHHERPDGKGYPCGLSGNALPQQARIIAVADGFDAMTSDRVYRKRMTVAKAVEILREGRGNQWDADCVDVFLAIVEERATPRLQMLAAEDSGRQYLPSIGIDVFGTGA